MCNLQPKILRGRLCMLKKLIITLLTFYTAWAMAAVDINKASHTDLLEIKGIGPATATRIIDARKQGPFKSWEDFIQRVKGIAENSATKLSASGVTVNGQAYKSSKKTSAPAANTTEKSAKPSQTASKK